MDVFSVLLGSGPTYEHLPTVITQILPRKRGVLQRSEGTTSSLEAIFTLKLFKVMQELYLHLQ